MNIAVSQLIGRIQQMIDDESSETRIDILRHCNIAYLELGAEHSWSFLTEIVTGTNANGLLPADFQRFVYAEDGNNKAYFKSGRLVRYSDPRFYKYFKDVTTFNTPLAHGFDGIVAENGTAFTSAAPSAAFTAALVGEYIRIGQNLGVYKISAVPDGNTLTLTNGYRGAAETAAYYEVRPVGCPKMGTYDEDGDLLSSASLQFWYLRSPLPLYNDYDRVLLPGTAEALRIRVCQLMDQTNKYDNDALKKAGDYEDAKSKMMQLDPVPERFVVPRDRNGNRLMFGRNRTISSAYIPDSGAF